MQHIKAQQFHTDLGLLSTVLSPTENSRIQGLFKALSYFPILFKADLIFKDFSRKPSKFKLFSSLCEPCLFLYSGLEYLSGILVDIAILTYYSVITGLDKQNNSA